MQEQLKVCPACGSIEMDLGVSEAQSCEDAMIWVQCLHCDARGPAYPRYVCGREKAITAWNDMPRALKWQRTSPTKAGFYFYKSSKGQIMVTHIESLELVHRRGLTAVMMVDGDVEQELDRLPGQWAGPITEPVEKE